MAAHISCKLVLMLISHVNCFVLIGQRLDQVCGTVNNCARELSDLGLLRAQLFANWADKEGIVSNLDLVFATAKRRNFQTVEPAADLAGLEVHQYPEGATELNPDGADSSVCPMVQAIKDAPAGSTILVTGNTGTLYPTMGDGNDDCDGLGVDTSDETLFPRDARGRVPGDRFGDVWAVEINENGVARFKDLTVLEFGLAGLPVRLAGEERLSNEKREKD